MTRKRILGAEPQLAHTVQPSSAGWLAGFAGAASADAKAASMRNAPIKIRVCVVTMDTHLASATARALPTLVREYPGMTLSLHAASEYAGNDALIAHVKADILKAMDETPIMKERVRARKLIDDMTKMLSAAAEAEKALMAMLT